MRQRIQSFLRGVSVNGFARTGVFLAVTSFFLFLLYELLRATGVLPSYKLGLFAFLLLPGLFLLGWILALWGWWRACRRSGKTCARLTRERFPESELQLRTWGTGLMGTFLLLAVVSALFFVGANLSMLSFMEEAEFCGTACHSVMNPEWTTYQGSPHAHVRCVECHVGEGLGAMVDAKINGTWQMISVTFDLLERPIPTPVHNLRPARETCEKCHWPRKFYGSRLKTIVRYAEDEESTPLYTTLNLKVNTPEDVHKGGGIHWHVAQGVEVRYASVDDEREEILWVEARYPDGTVHRFRNRKIGGETGVARTMDCVDCHNRATHIYEDPNQAVDLRLARGELDRVLPYIKREAVHALTRNYPDRETALEGIAVHLRNFYQREFPGVFRGHQLQLETAVATVQEIYARNIHPEMNIGWGSYPNHLGHTTSRGCFRCHSPELVDDDGEQISDDCTLCHSILAREEPHPFSYLLPVGADSTAPNRRMHEYLQDEFLHRH